MHSARKDGSSRVEVEPNSTVPRRTLGRLLRRHRTTAKITIKAAAEQLECSEQKIWRIETGQGPVRLADVSLLCSVYGVPPDIKDVLIGLSKETKAKGWWQSYGDVVPEWFELFVGLEGAARRIRKFEPALVPGLLQAHAYMETVISTDPPDRTPEDVQRRIAVKQNRQRLLQREFPEPPRLEVIMWEPVLDAAPAVPGAMQQQLWHLLKADELTHVSIRILPTTAGLSVPSVAGAFTIFEFPIDNGERVEPPIVYSESLTGALYLDKRDELEAYERVWSQMDGVALSETESAELIHQKLKELGMP